MDVVTIVLTLAWLLPWIGSRWPGFARKNYYTFVIAQKLTVIRHRAALFPQELKKMVHSRIRTEGTLHGTKSSIVTSKFRMYLHFLPLWDVIKMS